jgi:hypothetical protein
MVSSGNLHLSCLSIGLTLPGYERPYGVASDMVCSCWQPLLVSDDSIANHRRANPLATPHTTQATIYAKGAKRQAFSLSQSRQSTGFVISESISSSLVTTAELQNPAMRRREMLQSRRALKHPCICQGKATPVQPVLSQLKSWLMTHDGDHVSL